MAAPRSPKSAKSEKSLAELPDIPDKQYFSISEAAVLCGVKAHVLRYWEQEFPQLRPLKRRGNRRYYQHPDLLLVRRIRLLLYGEGFTIHGARERLAQKSDAGDASVQSAQLDLDMGLSVVASDGMDSTQRLHWLREELKEMLALCSAVIDRRPDKT